MADEQPVQEGAQPLVTLLRQQIDAQRGQIEQLQNLRRLLADTGRRSLELHRETRRTLRSLRRDLERVQRRLKSLGTAR